MPGSTTVHVHDVAHFSIPPAESYQRTRMVNINVQIHFSFMQTFTCSCLLVAFNGREPTSGKANILTWVSSYERTISNEKRSSTS